MRNMSSFPKMKKSKIISIYRTISEDILIQSSKDNQLNFSSKNFSKNICFKVLDYIV